MLVIQYKEHKGFAEDLSEGKFSFPVIHGIRGKRDSKYIISTNGVSLMSVERTKLFRRCPPSKAERSNAQASRDLVSQGSDTFV